MMRAFVPAIDVLDQPTNLTVHTTAVDGERHVWLAAATNPDEPGVSDYQLTPAQAAALGRALLATADGAVA